MTGDIEAVVIPADPTQPLRVITFPMQRLAWVVEETIGCHGTDKTPPLTARNGDRFRVWVDDVGLLADQPVWNDRAIVLVRAAGYAGDMAGDAVVTGAEDESGWTQGVPVQLRNRMLEHLTPVSRAEYDAAVARSRAAERGSKGARDDQ